MSDNYNGPTQPYNGDDVLVLLKKICLLLFGGAGGGTGEEGGGGTARAIAVSTVTENGTVASGKKGIQFIFSTDFVGTIGGVAFAGADDAVYSPPPLQGADTYGALVYTISAGSARLTTIA